MAALGSTVKVETEAGLAKLSLVGIGMRSHSGVGATAFKALADANIKTGMISTSEIKIAVMVDESDIEEKVGPGGAQGVQPGRLTLPPFFRPGSRKREPVFFVHFPPCPGQGGEC